LLRRKARDILFTGESEIAGFSVRPRGNDSSRSYRVLVACPDCHRQYDVSGIPPGKKVRCHCTGLVTVPEERRIEKPMLHCSSCGGKLNAEGTSCEYCGCDVRLDQRGFGESCPECFARMRSGAKFCSGCGVAIAPERMRALAVEASCPRCRVSLVQCTHDRGQYTECSSCGGLWLDEETFRRIIEDNDEPPILARDRTTTPIRVSVDATNVRYVPCPNCAQLMHRRNFGGVSGIIIDWCKGCGYWFDLEELQKIVVFVRDGGMDVVRRREQHRAKEEATKRKARELSSLRRPVERSVGKSFDDRPVGTTIEASDIVEFLASLGKSFRAFFDR
jgi:Zn-finger nucleic acid-binding protein